MAHHHTYTITDALGDGQEGVGWTLPTPTAHLHRRRSVNPLTVSPPSPSALPTNTPTATILEVFDGTALYATTLPLLLLTTIPASTITAPDSSVTTVPASVAIAQTSHWGPYPADGCWDDSGCWESRTHTVDPTAVITATASPSGGGMVKGYDGEAPPSAAKFFTDLGLYSFIGVGVALVVVGAVLGVGRWVLGRRVRRERERGSGSERGGANGSGEGGKKEDGKKEKEEREAKKAETKEEKEMKAKRRKEKLREMARWFKTRYLGRQGEEVELEEYPAEEARNGDVEEEGGFATFDERSGNCHVVAGDEGGWGKETGVGDESGQDFDEVTLASFV